MLDDEGVVGLRPLTPEDVNDEYLRWFADPGVTAFLDARNISREEAIEHLEAGRRTGNYEMFAIVDPAAGAHIGNLKLGPINWQHGVSDLVTVIGRRDYWGRGLATRVVRLGIDIAFREHDLRKMRASIMAGNEGSVRAYTRAGFVVEAVLAGDLLLDGEARDRIVISCFNPRYFPDRA